MAHVAHASRDAQVNTALPDLLKDLFDQTIADGHGKDGLTSVIEVLKKSS